jgi:hypothetical protein
LAVLAVPVGTVPTSVDAMPGAAFINPGVDAGVVGVAVRDPDEDILKFLDDG